MVISLYLTLALVFVLDCTPGPARAPARPDRSKQTSQLPGRVALPDSTATGNADDGQWTMAPRDFANTRYSCLDQITTANARALHVAWTFSIGVLRGQEAAPLVVGSTMYVVTPF